MDALRRKYKDHKEDVLQVVRVTNDLLALLTREGLLDIADCVRYQGIADMRRRTQAFLEMLTERRTDRAYRVLIQGLRETGQDNAADLLTDVEEEANLIVQLQKQLDERIEGIDDFIQNEIDRARLEKKTVVEKKPCGHPKKKLPEPKSRVGKGKEEDNAQQVKDKEIWTNAQESMKRATEQLERCKLVIGKLHQDCHTATESSINMEAQTRDCYIQLSKMIRPSQKHTRDNKDCNTLNMQELFQMLVDDLHGLMVRESKAQEREIEGRTTAMRTLRQLRDWILDRSGILTSLHSTFRPIANPRFKSPHPTISQIPMMTSSQHHPSYTHRVVSPDRSESLNFHEPMDSANFQDNLNDSLLGGQKALLPVPFATSTPRPSDSGEKRSQSLEVQPISTLVEGVTILEKQLREYIHLEILLTDKFRHEMRMKQHQQKAQGFTPQGIHEARSILGRLTTTNDNTDLDSIHKLKTQLERISMEYNECGKYMDKVVSSMSKIDNVDEFLKTLYEREKQYKKDMNKPEKKLKGNRKNGEVKDSHTSLVEMLKTHSKSQNSKLDKAPFSNSSRLKEKLRLPSITPQSDDNGKNMSDLLTKLKILVANFEIVRLRMLTVEDRFRRELCRRERKFESILRSKEEDIHRLQTSLNESEAEKDKYLRLYNSTKLSTSRTKK